MIAPGAKIGFWTVVEIDESGRRALCECCCKNLRSLMIASLLDGTAAASCGCTPPTRKKNARHRDLTKTSRAH
jgi:hypothetical protein